MFNLLKIMFGAILLTMLKVTVDAQKDTPIWKIPKTVTNDPWFKATLFDAYFGFLTFYAWVFYKEKSLASRLFWFIAIMLGGNAAMSSYMLIQLNKLKTASAPELLNRNSDLQVSK